MNRSKEYEDRSAKEYFEEVEKERQKQIKKMELQHKCNSCIWANSYNRYCMFPKCFKNKTNT